MKNSKKNFPKNNSMKIDTAMVLAAGLGKRMRPITETIPKPLIPVMGTPMLESIIKKLKASDFKNIVINAYYLKDQIITFVEDRADSTLIVSEEDRILETGGGVTQALPLLGEQPFVVVNGDVCWLDGAEPALTRLLNYWDADNMDALLLLHPTSRAYGYEGNGDFFMDQNGYLTRKVEGKVTPFVYAGLQILHPKLFKDAPQEAFSLNDIFDIALANKRLCGLRHDGEWFHVGTPEGLMEVEAILHNMAKPAP